MHFPDIIGLFGVLLILIAYFLLQTARILSTSIDYSLYNSVGAMLIIYSLLYKWNLSAFVMEGTWLILSVYGCYKAYKLKNIT